MDATWVESACARCFAILDSFARFCNRARNSGGATRLHPRRASPLQCVHPRCGPDYGLSETEECGAQRRMQADHLGGNETVRQQWKRWSPGTSRTMKRVAKTT